MNANELADELIEVTGELWISRQCANVLRQFDLAESIIKQQKLEIEALKLQLHTTLTNRDLRTYDGKTEVNNEPLALTLRKAQEK